MGKLHAKIMHLMMESEIFEDKVKFFDLEDKNTTLKVAYIKAKEEEDVFVVFNLPTISDKLFITVSDGDPEKIAAVLSHLEEVDATKKSLGLTHVVRFNDPYFLNYKKVGVIIVKKGVSPVLRHFPDEVEYEDKLITPFLVIFITEEEYLCWKNEGHNQLMEMFDKNNKDLITI